MGEGKGAYAVSSNASCAMATRHEYTRLKTLSSFNLAGGKNWFRNRMYNNNLIFTGLADVYRFH